MTSIIGFVFLALVAGIIYAIVGKKISGGAGGQGF